MLKRLIAVVFCCTGANTEVSKETFDDESFAISILKKSLSANMRASSMSPDSNGARSTTSANVHELFKRAPFWGNVAPASQFFQLDQVDEVILSVTTELAGRRGFVAVEHLAQNRAGNACDFFVDRFEVFEAGSFNIYSWKCPRAFHDFQKIFKIVSGDAKQVDEKVELHL